MLKKKGKHPDPFMNHLKPAGHIFVQFSLVQPLSYVRLFVTPWTATRQTSLFITNSRSLLKLMSIELVMPFKHFILCRPLLLPTSIFPSIRVFFNESVLCIRWPKYFRVEKFFSMLLQWWSMTLCSYWNLWTLWASQVAQWLKNPLAMQEIQVWYLGQEDPPGGGHGNPLQYSCLENPMHKGAWQATVHKVTKS